MADPVYAVELTRQAEKDLRDLPARGQDKALRAILALEGDPRRGHTLTG